MSNAQIRELDQVRLEPARPKEYRDSDQESDPTDIDEDEEDPAYVIDAICWAEYKDSTFERSRGAVGWHYYVMWQGYLKTGSDTIELRRSFVDDPSDPSERSPALLEFWKSVEGKKVRKGKDEPGGKIGEIRFASDDLLKRKFREATPERSFSAYQRRIAKFKNARSDGFNRALVRKGDSDYYIRKKREEQKAEKKKAGKAITQPIPKRERAEEIVAGPSRRRGQSSSDDEPLASKRRKRSDAVEKMPPPATTLARRAPTQTDESPAPRVSRQRSFDSLFDEASQPSNSQTQAATPGVSSRKRTTKRRRAVESPVSSPVEEKVKAPDVPRFELDTSIFSAANPLAPPHRKQTPLFDFGDQASTPREASGIKVEASTPAETLELRSDDPDEEEEEIEVQEIEPPPGPKPNTPISVLDSEDEVAAEVAPTYDDGSPDHPDTALLGNFIPFSSSPPVPIQALPPPPTQAARFPTPPPQPPRPQPQQASQPVQAVQPDKLAKNVDLSGLPLPIHLPPSPPRNYRAVGADSVFERQNETRRTDAARTGPTAVRAPAPAPAPSFAGAVAHTPPPPAPAVPAAPRAATTAPVPAAQALPTNPTATVPFTAKPSTGSLPPEPPAKAPSPTKPKSPSLSITTENAEAGPSRPSANSASSGTPVSGTPVSASVRPKPNMPVNLSDRPKYQQPSRIQLIDISVDPARDKSPLRVQLLHPRRRLVGLGLLNINLLRGFRPTGSRPGLPQHGAFGDVSPYGGISPHGLSNRSPYQGGISPMNGGKSPNAPAGFGGAAPDYPGPSKRPGSSFGPRPTYRAGSLSGPSLQQPQQLQQEQWSPPNPLPAAPGRGSYEARRDPRLRRAAAVPSTTPPQPTTTPPAPQPSANPPQPSAAPPPLPPATSSIQEQPALAATRVLCTFHAAHANAHPDAYTKGLVDITLRSGWSSEKSSFLEKHINTQHTYLFEEVDRRCLQLLLIEGARIIEWALVEVPRQPSEIWQSLQRKMERRNILVFLDEVRAPNLLVTSRNILLMSRADQSRIGVDADLNGWKMEQLTYVAFLVKVPLVPNEKVADLPNPVRPFAQKEQPPALAIPRRLHSIASSFGFDDDTASQLGQEKTLSVVPNYFRPTVLYHEIVATAERCGLKPNNEDPETILVLNGAFSQTTTSKRFRRTLTKETRYMSIGADLTSIISRWQLRPIWETGGLVTFSPTFFLLQHRSLGEIMNVIRSAPNWAAYITPTTLLYVNDMIEKKKSPDPARSFVALTQALSLDDNQRRIAGEMSTETSSLVVSAAPPMLVLRQPCELWIDWLGKIFECTDYATLLKLCRQWARVCNHAESGLALLDTEKISIADLIKMRNLPHIVPYRRCIYVGSIKDEQSREATANGIDVISPDAFFSTFMDSK
ncbi:uncharacterized protein CcaverHIS019_0506550 [Cutaneotrichosporon cavernicola]|uniref:Chromo domain-containing protein n=1 Tax=Cutaneotrichosporon cavernicola TaxID=279322 RepID=A0AA48L6T8_9TREE|nr:uncharacterized protein CcaverHIS019_0506550 [Cutaneotrichosporon cavernicola]BEI93027.1 hypothetical protein CcaverHIS019_0506550 [Cutaneotrichosporon cavernicola]BEJ08570.1 hypothetical protein CcaverHIS641_0506640 [Cutaneotrichosporon cavernicola]